MNKALIFSAMIFSTFAIPTLNSYAVTLVVVGTDPTPLLQVSEDFEAGDTVGLFSVRQFEMKAHEGSFSFVGSEAAIAQINDLKEKIEMIGTDSMKAYGWCFSINGVAPDFMPNQVQITSDSDQIRWFYAYSLYAEGEWKNQCVPVVKPE